MELILDADVLIEGEHGNFDLETYFRQHGTVQFGMAAVTAAELWRGVEQATGAYRARRRRYIEALLSQLPVFAYTLETALEHARLWADLEREGRMIGPYDLIVAATALERGAAVLTFNRKYYAKVNGLKVITPERV
jgi:tRNA(fMet)-specific endonuclease VapC